MNLFIKKLGVILASVALLGTWFITPNAISSGSDCDGNAVIYCGASTTSVLASKIKNGTGKPFQSGAELTALYAKFGIRAADFGNLREGRVTKDNKVYAGNSVVATNVYSMGRHNIYPSTQVSGVNYPLYLRHPSVSFVANSLDAWVYVNYDNTMAYAVIKSCGNIVPGVGIRVRPVLYRGFARKFNDLNENGRLDAGEPRMAGVTFRLTGNGQNQTNVTDSSGYAGFWNLRAGTYTVTEVVPAGWHSTTGTTRTLVVDADRRFVDFGNARNRTTQVGLRIVKFNDTNANGSQDDNEPLLSGWAFRVVGPNFDRIVTTDANGTSTITGLQPGIYTVTEINQAGWTNTTGLSIQRNVTTDPATQTFVFGNRRNETPPGPGGGESLPKSGTADAAGAAGATTTMIGAVVAWINSKRSFLATLKK